MLVLETLVLDHLKIPLVIFFSTLTTCLLDFELIWFGEIMSLSFRGVKGLIFHVADDSR